MSSRSSQRSAGRAAPGSLPSQAYQNVVPLTVTNGDGTTATVSRFRYVAEKLRFKVPSKVQLSSDEEASYGALGDFNGDGVLDLLISETSKDGLIVVLANDKAFASKRYAQTASQPKGVAAGDFDGDGRDDLAVGVPSPGDFTDGSFVVIHRGLPGGIELAAQQLFRPGEGGVPVVPGDYDVFGAALAVGNFNADSYDDLAIGAPQNNLNDGCGGVVVLHGGPTGLSIIVVTTGSIPLPFPGA